jgi:hypothetical protein
MGFDKTKTIYLLYFFIIGRKQCRVFRNAKKVICALLNYPFVMRNFDPLEGRFYSTFPKLYFGETSFHPRRGALLLATYPYFVFYWY